jgi:non-heme chloroperoxidase
MIKKILWICALPMLLASGLHAQDIAGDWQGILKADRDLRLVMHFANEDGPGWSATVFSIDQRPDRGAGVAATAVTMSGSDLKVTVDEIRKYEGKVSEDGMSITGTWLQGGRPPVPLNFQRATKDTAWPHASAHAVQTIIVDKNVTLEVLDWGGAGRPLVFLAGGGNTAHVFDAFVPKLTDTYHVYGITRRGFGASSVPASGYAADRLGDDVLEVLDALKIPRPILVGHSLAGEELSSVATRRPERVAGLIYLDAAYSYAYYDESKGNLWIDSIDLQRKLEQLRWQPNSSKLISELLRTALPQFEKGLREKLKDLQEMPTPPAIADAPPKPTPVTLIQAGYQKYTSIKVPALAIFAFPNEVPLTGQNEATRAAAEANDLAREAQAKAFETGVPSARVVRLPHANHMVFLSNEADVLREIRAFLASLR